MDLICLDLDNTLIDSDKPHIIAYNLALKKNNLKPVSEKKFKKLFGLVGFEIIKGIYPKLNRKKITKVLEDHDDFFINQTRKYLKPFKDAKSTLKKLKKRYKIALISNCNKREIIASLKTSGLNKNLFNALIGYDSVKKPKPYPDEILKAQKIFHCKAEYIIGDSIYDIMAGKRANVKTIAVATGNHSREELKKEKPDFLFKRFKDVLKVL
ncbi:HAD-IA family hydrolase [Candidatus Woesearchaeota archaeon]|nr:HAD-IA family hydrolase [Candidatus Woesearchaeota archaeon]